MMKVEQGPQGEMDIRLSGAFDWSLAARLEKCLGERAQAGPVTVDFTHVRGVDVAAAARALVGVSGLKLCGLTRHLLRVLRYCGVETPPARFLHEGEPRF